MDLLAQSTKSGSKRLGQSSKLRAGSPADRECSRVECVAFGTMLTGPHRDEIDMRVGLIESSETVSGLITATLIPFMLLAALGFLLSVAAHVASIANIPLPGGQSIWILHAGIFVVWLPTVLVAVRVTRGERRQDFWKVLLSGCPPWMRKSAYVLLVYVILNFVYFMATTSQVRHAAGDPPPSVIRGFSGHWMIFYAAAFMTLYSVIKRPALLGRSFCSNGHAVSRSDKFCPTCGVDCGHSA